MKDLSEAPPEEPPLKLAALDGEDLAILSAHLQDATVKVGDMAYLPKTRRFVFVAARFDWLKAARGGCERCATGVHFERVLSVKRTGFSQNAEDTLSLVAVMFLPEDAPSGTVILGFSGGAAVRLEVECVEAGMSDLGSRWAVDAKPLGPSEAGQPSA